MSAPGSHSPFGGSAAARGLKCPASILLAESAHSIEPIEDEEFSKPGQAAHALGEKCINDGTQPWMSIDHMMPTDSGEHEVDAEMAVAVQMYVDFVNETFPDRDQGNSWNEQSFLCPWLHQWFYGTNDFGYLDTADRRLHVADFKYGAGIVVEVPDNVQLMYYACGLLEYRGLWDAVDNVTVYIVQPRGWHSDGPIREWSVSAEQLKHWLHKVLIPGMKRSENSNEMQSGEHCRFCQVRHTKCPQLAEDWARVKSLVERLAAGIPEGTKEKEALKIVKQRATAFKNAELGEMLGLFELAKITAKGARSVAYSRVWACSRLRSCTMASS